MQFNKYAHTQSTLIHILFVDSIAWLHSISSLVFLVNKVKNDILKRNKTLNTLQQEEYTKKMSQNVFRPNNVNATKYMEDCLGFLLLCMYVCMYGHTYSNSMDQPGKVASPARGQLNRKNKYFQGFPREFPRGILTAVKLR